MIRACLCGHFENAHRGDRCDLCIICTGFKDTTTGHTARLLTLAEPALATAKKRLERNPSFNAFFRLELPPGAQIAGSIKLGASEILQLQMPPWAGPIMNDGEAKDVLFAYVRKTVQETQATAVALVSDQFYSRTTEKAREDLRADRITIAELKRLAGRGDGFEEMEKRGYAIRGECLGVIVQTPERCMMLHQAYERFGRRQIVWREGFRCEMRIDEFEGRQKMFGDLSAEKLR